MNRGAALRGATDERDILERDAEDRGTDAGRFGRGVDRAAVERGTELLAAAEPDAAEREDCGVTLPEADLWKAELA